MTIVPKKKSESRSANKSSGVVAPSKSKPAQQQEIDHKEHEHHHTQQAAHHRRSPLLQCSTSGDNNVVSGGGEDAEYSGYNSGDEHTEDRRPTTYTQWTDQDFLEQDNQFEQTINKKGWVIRKMAEDGACLFRAVADQIYGDQDMHSVLRKLCIDYIAKNSDYFSQYVTEDFGEYLKRKSLDHSHGNHIEIQAMSEMFNRPIEVYHYSNEPINIFQGPARGDNEPIRLSYHRSVHYNSIVDPFKATVGVGLGLPAYDPGVADKTLLDDAIRLSDEDAIEKAMLEDKLLATDWEATNEAIEQQVARESYLEWVRENENRLRKKFKKSSSPQPTTAAACSKQTSSTSYHDHDHHHHDHHHQQTTSSSSPSSSHLMEQVAGCSKSSPSSSSYGGPTPCSSNLNDAYKDSYCKAGTSASSGASSSHHNPNQGNSCSPLANSSSSSSSGSSRRSPRASSSRDISS